MKRIAGCVIAVEMACLGAAGCVTNHPDRTLTDTARVSPGHETRGIRYWDEQRIGANYFNEVPTQDWFASAVEGNIRLVRLTYGKWEGEQRDFLLGSADDYQGLVEKDLARLRRYLDLADLLGIKVVLAPLSLPGARQRQFNGGKRDPRLWTDPKYLAQAVRFWQDLARRLKGHPAVAAYNLINEPHPEWFHGKRTFWNKGFKEWCGKVKGTPGDLNRFNRAVVTGIREVDPETPIIVESGLYATPWAFEYLEPLEDDKILYSLHMYEPYDYTTRRINKGRYSYPGNMFIDELDTGRTFDARALDEFFNPVRQWAQQHGIPPSRIFVGEFGCDRMVGGAAEYLADLVSVFNRERWHWAFYAYREDDWPAMDYELGTDKAGETYWTASEAGELHKQYSKIYNPRQDNPVWAVLKGEFEKRR